MNAHRWLRLLIGAFSLLVFGLVLASCGGAEGGRGRIGEDYPPLPGPEPDVEVVAVSENIASPEQPVFYTRHPTNEHRLIAYDWNGSKRGELTVSASDAYGVYPSEDGTMLLLSHAHVVSGGKKVGEASRGTWAEDNEHTCVFLNEKGGPGFPQERQVSENHFEGRDTDATLFLQDTSGQRERVAEFGAFGPHGGPAVLACNVADDFAIVTSTFVGHQSSPEVIRLSDGQTIGQMGSGDRTPGIQGFVSSMDGSLLTQGYTAGIFGDGFTVHAVPDGRLVATIADGGALTFSGDNSRVVSVDYQNGSSESAIYRVVEVATGRVVWERTIRPGPVLTRPDSADVIVAASIWEDPPAGSNTRQRFNDLWLIPADGSPRLLLAHSARIAGVW